MEQMNRQLQQSFQIATGLIQAVVAAVWSGNWEREMRKSWTPGIPIRPGKGESPSPDGPLEIQGAAGWTSGLRRDKVHCSGSPRTTSEKNSPMVLIGLDRFSTGSLTCLQYPIWYVV